jgi:hypothetical protein
MPSSGIWRHSPEDGIFHGHRRENLKSYKELVSKFPKPAKELVAKFQKSAKELVAKFRKLVTQLVAKFYKSTDRFLLSISTITTMSF